MSSFEGFLSNDDYIQSLTEITTGVTKGILTVESRNDVGFWSYIIENVIPNRYVIFPASQIKTSGKRTLEAMYADLHSNNIVAVDSDLDYLCAERSDNAKALNQNPYILHTFSYSIESLQCSLESLTDLIKRLTFSDNVKHDVITTLEKVSNLIYPALSIHLFRHNLSPAQFADGTLWPYLKLPANKTLLQKRSLQENTAVLNNLKRKIDSFIEKYQIQQHELEDYAAFMRELETKGLVPGTAYQFIKGHILHDSYAFPMLKQCRDKMMTNEKRKIGIKYKEEIEKEEKKEDRKEEMKMHLGEVDKFYEKTNVLETLFNNTQNYTTNAVYQKIINKTQQLLS